MLPGRKQQLDKWQQVAVLLVGFRLLHCSVGAFQVLLTRIKIRAAVIKHLFFHDESLRQKTLSVAPWSLEQAPARGDFAPYRARYRFDHKNLNEDTAEFKDLNPSAENIVIVIYNILREKIDSKFDLQVRLYETEKNFVDYPVS